MPRAAVIALLGVALAAGGCGPEPEAVPLPPLQAAPPGVYELGWRESYPAEGPALRFVVERLRVRRSGWSAEVAVENGTTIPWRIDRSGFGPRFGLMLFADDDLAAVEEAGRRGRLPPPRPARTLTPEPPDVLQPGARWQGTLAAPGALPHGAFARVVFGRFVAAEEPPNGMQRNVLWITDSARRLSAQ